MTRVQQSTALCVILVMGGVLSAPHEVPDQTADPSNNKDLSLMAKLEAYIDRMTKQRHPMKGMDKSNGDMMDNPHGDMTGKQQDNANNKPAVDMSDPHHGVKMGIPYAPCDNGVLGIETDYNQAYIDCDSSVELKFNSEPIDIVQDALPAQHVCLNTKIDYGTPLPLNGDHRPLWPKFGEYTFLPPSRWVHSLEHGAVVLLYHPCTKTDASGSNDSDESNSDETDGDESDSVEKDSDESDSDESDSDEDHETDLDKLKAVLRGCLTKYIIAPYSLIPHDMPFALLAFRHARLLSNADISQATDFIKKYSLKGPETKVRSDGQYQAYLKTGVSVVNNDNRCVND